MDYDHWPDIVSSCPVCNQKSCAIYRGYYSRFLFCTELEFFGLVVIRTGFCKCQKVRFHFLPDFIIRRRSLSVFTHQRLCEAYAIHKKISAAIDEINSDLEEEFFLPLSTAHNFIRLRFAKPP